MNKTQPHRLTISRSSSIAARIQLLQALKLQGYLDYPTRPSSHAALCSITSSITTCTLVNFQEEDYTAREDTMLILGLQHMASIALVMGRAVEGSPITLISSHTGSMGLLLISSMVQEFMDILEVQILFTRHRYLLLAI